MEEVMLVSGQRVSQLRVPDLRSELEARQLDTKGPKRELVRRLTQHLLSFVDSPAPQNKENNENVPSNERRTRRSAPLSVNLGNLSLHEGKDDDDNDTPHHVAVVKSPAKSESVRKPRRRWFEDGEQQQQAAPTERVETTAQTPAPSSEQVPQTKTPSSARPQSRVQRKSGFHFNIESTPRVRFASGTDIAQVQQRKSVIPRTPAPRMSVKEAVKPTRQSTATRQHAKAATIGPIGTGSKLRLGRYSFVETSKLKDDELRFARRIGFISGYGRVNLHVDVSTLSHQDRTRFNAILAKLRLEQKK